jgi:hypothetical protein
MEYRLTTCPECGGNTAEPQPDLITNPDGSIWLHYDCKCGHKFHRTLAANPMRYVECNCGE